MPSFALLLLERRGNPEEWPAGEARAVTVVGLKEGGNGEESDCNAGDLSMLFRLQGPEALAEVDVFRAQQVQGGLDRIFFCNLLQHRTPTKTASNKRLRLKLSWENKYGSRFTKDSVDRSLFRVINPA